MNPSSDRGFEPIPFARPSIGPEEEQAVLEVLRSGWLTTGEQCQLFEQEFSLSLGGNIHALTVSSATAGLHLALDVLGVGPGDRVAMSPYTFVATAEVVRYLGAEPVFIDTEPGSLHLDPLSLEVAINEYQKKGTPICGAIAVHIAGSSWRMEELTTLCRREGLWLVEDAAHTFPSRIPSGFHGTLGDIGVFSFYANKTITTGEGGMVVTKNSKWAESMKRKRLHGINREVWNRYRETGASWQYAVTDLGYKYNLTDMAAAIGREQLKKAQDFLLARRRIANFYTQELLSIENLQLPPAGDGPSSGVLLNKASNEVISPDLPQPLPEYLKNTNFTGDAHAWHLYIIQTKHRDALSLQLSSRGIGTSMHFIPLHRMPYYKDRGWMDGQFPNAEKSADCALSIPIYPSLSQESSHRIVEEIKKIFDTLM